MKPLIPSDVVNQDQYNKSLTKILSGNVSPGNGLTFDPKGIPITFSQDNTCGQILRIAGSASNPYSLPNQWQARSSDTTIQHSLNKVPYGFILISSSSFTSVAWGSLAPTLNTITLINQNDGVETTIWLLA